MDNLRDQLRAYYMRQRLPEHRLEQLPGVMGRPWGRGALVAATLAVAFVAGATVGWWLPRAPGPTLAAEVAGHHADYLAEVADFDAPGAMPGRLVAQLEPPFELPRSVFDAFAEHLPDYALAGANHCRVQGDRAIQFVYHDAGGNVATAYVRPWDGPAIHELKAQVGGRAIQAWTHHGRLYAVVRGG